MSGTITTGTGKYAGISGGWTFVVHGPEFRTAAEGTYVTYGPLQGGYRLPEVCGSRHCSWHSGKEPTSETRILNIAEDAIKRLSRKYSAPANEHLNRGRNVRCERTNAFCPP